MPVSVDKLVTQANARIALGNQDAQDLARLVGVANVTDTIYSVPTTLDLPAAADNVGRMIYVEDLGVYRYSNGTEWTNDYDTVLISSSSLFSWGCNICGFLGDGTVIDKSSPVKEISSSTNWCQASAGSLHSSAIKKDGTLWSWGSNNSGQFGDGTVIPKSSPTQEISLSTNWTKVSAGCRYTAAIKTDGTLWSWGLSNNGQLGDGTVISKSSLVQEISSSTNWCQVSAGNSHSAAVKTDGTLWSWGEGNCGQLGNLNVLNSCSPVQEISSSTNWRQSSLGQRFSTAIKDDGTLWSWGDAFSGALGDGTIVNKSSPVQEISSSTSWCTISSGLSHGAAIKTDGTLWSWGYGAAGRLGDGTTTSKCSPVQEISSSTNWCQVSAGSCHSVAVKTDGSLWAWGDNACGMLGDGTAVTDKCSPVQEISSSTNWCQASGGQRFSLAIGYDAIKGFNAI